MSLRKILRLQIVFFLLLALPLPETLADKPGEACLVSYRELDDQPSNRKVSVERMVNTANAFGRSEAISRDLTEQAAKEISERADALKAALQARSNDPAVVAWDSVAIGGGPENVILSVNLPAKAKKLTVESSGQLVNTFRSPGPTFRINSPELLDATANGIPNGKFQLKKVSNGKFVRADELQRPFILNHYATNTEALLKTRAAPIEDMGVQRNTGLPRFKVNLEGTNPVYGDRVFIGTGLGEKSFGVKDPATLAVIKRESQKAPTSPDLVPGIQHFDDAMAAAAQRIERGISFQAPYENKVVAVVGSGDGANVFVEGALGKGPDQAYPAGRGNGPRMLLWLSQKAKTAEDYKKLNKLRYHDTLAEEIEAQTRTRSFPHHLAGVEKITSGRDKGRYRLLLEQKLPDGTVNTAAEVADQVVFATGYRNNATDLLSKLPEHKLVDVIGKLAPDGPDTIIGREVQYMDGSKPGIFIYGPAAGELATPEELATTITKNPVSFNVVGPRTAALGRQIPAPDSPKPAFCADSLCTTK